VILGLLNSRVRLMSESKIRDLTLPTFLWFLHARLPKSCNPLLKVMNRPKLSEVAILIALRDLELLDAQTCCDRWHRLDHLSDLDQLQARSKYGYRAKCVRLLSAVLRVKESTVTTWGENFERMPDHYKPALLYADVLRQTLSASNQSGWLDLYLNPQGQEN
jgi:hypothetical protein